MNYTIAASIAAISAIFTVVPASAVVTTFATYSAKTSADNLRLVNLARIIHQASGSGLASVA